MTSITKDYLQIAPSHLLLCLLKEHKDFMNYKYYCSAKFCLFRVKNKHTNKTLIGLLHHLFCAFEQFSLK